MASDDTLAKLAPSSVLAFSEALNGPKGQLDAWLECNDEAEVKAHIRALTAQALPAAPEPAPAEKPALSEPGNGIVGIVRHQLKG